MAEYLYHLYVNFLGTLVFIDIILCMYGVWSIILFLGGDEEGKTAVKKAALFFGSITAVIMLLPPRNLIYDLLTVRFPS